MRAGAAAVLLLVTGVSSPLPPPLPPPGDLPSPPRRTPDDPLDLLWAHRLVFAPGGAPLVTIRLAEGQREIAFRPRGRARLQPRGGPAVEIPAGQTFRVRADGALPAALAHHALLGEALQADRRRLDTTRALWEGRGQVVSQRVVGGVYGIAGRVIDNRRVALLVEGDGSEASARRFAEESLARWGGRTGVFSEVVRRPSGRVEVRDAAGAVVAQGDALVTLEVDGDAGFTVERVEHDAGHAAHGFEDRAYQGVLHLTLDASGRLAAVLGVGLEELLRGLVPSEMPAGSPREALRAQAVTARSNVLAQIGTRHLGDPYVLCSEVHCQAYRGAGARAPSTDAAVRDTAGEALFGRADRALVDAVYSAMCGGHGEDNDAVWPTLPDPSLRGRPDLPPAEARAWAGGLADEARLRAFLAAAPQAWCARGAGGRRDRYRWERRLDGSELARVAGVLGLGSVRALVVTSRGASGRARSLAVEAEDGRAVVDGELRIRRLLGNLPSAMFVVDRDGGALVLHGGGWGHGAGMCQWGAVGRAEAGQGYREILRAYYAGAEVAKIY
ncbi:MAG TPA: SpoIID/LytB domain-containing protein [Anaeromyxobacteraceae bacterium]|nr:SpoIID/LytB domain-containing protein [Anaeromyxobacteraceae bacterium]